MSLKIKRTYNRIGRFFHFNLLCRTTVIGGLRYVNVTVKMVMN